MDSDQSTTGSRPFSFGWILKGHGLAGEVKLALDLHSTAGLRPPFPATLVSAKGIRSECEILAMRGGDRHLLVKLAGVDDRHAADALRGAQLLVDREQLPEPGKGEFYLGDLVGYEMVMVTGERIGPILEVWDLPANDVLKVDYKGKEALIPLIDQVVISIDHSSGTVVIDPMEGLLE